MPRNWVYLSSDFFTGKWKERCGSSGFCRTDSLGCGMLVVMITFVKTYKKPPQCHLSLVIDSVLWPLSAWTEVQIYIIKHPFIGVVTHLFKAAKKVFYKIEKRIPLN